METLQIIIKLLVTRKSGRSIYVNNDSATNTKANIESITSYGTSDVPNDIKASSTQNMTGVFDLSVGLSESVAGFFKGASTSTPEWHNNMANTSTIVSTRYLTLYTDNYKFGDAYIETNRWNSEYISGFFSSNKPIICRGGSPNIASTQGVFTYIGGKGEPSIQNGFRVCITF